MPNLPDVPEQDWNSFAADRWFQQTNNQINSIAQMPLGPGLGFLNQSSGMINSLGQLPIPSPTFPPPQPAPMPAPQPAPVPLPQPTLPPLPTPAPAPGQVAPPTLPPPSIYAPPTTPTPAQSPFGGQANGPFAPSTPGVTPSVSETAPVTTI